MSEERSRSERITTGKRDIQSFWSSPAGAWTGIAFVAVGIVGIVLAVIR